MTGMHCGIDFGQRNDRTAIAIIEIVPAEDRPPWIDVRYIKRLPLNMGYPEQVSWIGALLGHEEVRRAETVVDATGVGVAVADMLRERLPGGFLELSLTGASVEHDRGANKISVPKRDLMSKLSIAMASRRVRIPDGLPEGAQLMREMENFGVKITESAHDAYSALKGHDDLVHALSYAVWQAERGNGARAWTDYVRKRHELDLEPPSPEPVVAEPFLAPPIDPDPLDDLEPLQRARTMRYRHDRRRLGI